MLETVEGGENIDPIGLPNLDGKSLRSCEEASMDVDKRSQKIQIQNL